jgi:hypothetical protein
MISNTKFKSAFFLHIIWVIIIVSFFVALFYVPVNAQSIAEQYKSEVSLSEGMLVSLQENDSEKIVATNMQNDKLFIGVTQNTESNLVTISKDFSDATVAISGEVSVLASDLGGSIKQGDELTVSWVDGVVMKNTDAVSQRIVGIALENFKDSNSSTYRNLDTPDGISDTAKVAYLRMKLVDVDTYGAAAETKTSSFGFIQQLTGKEVSVIRVFSGFAVFLATLIVASVFIYSSIKGSFISFGRNPLASNSIYAGLIQVSATSVGALIIGALLAYLIWVI